MNAQELAIEAIEALIAADAVAGNHDLAQIEAMIHKLSESDTRALRRMSALFFRATKACRYTATPDASADDE